MDIHIKFLLYRENAHCSSMSKHLKSFHCKFQGMFIIKMMLEKVVQCSSGKYLKVERSVNFFRVNKKISPPKKFIDT